MEPLNVLVGGAPQIKPVSRKTAAAWLSSRANKYELCKDWYVWIDGKEYVVPKGYITDGSSIPRYLWWLFPPSYSPAFRAAIFHDWCYSHYHRKVDKVWADAAFKAIMLYDDASPKVATLFHWAVSLGGRGGWK